MPKLDLQRATEPPGRVVRFRSVVIQENRVVAAITKEGAAEFSDIRRCFQAASVSPVYPSADTTILTVEMMLLAFERNYVEAAWTLVP